MLSWFPGAAPETVGATGAFSSTLGKDNCGTSSGSSSSTGAAGTTGVGSAGRASSSGAPGLPGTVSPSVLLESLVVSSYNSCEESWRETISTSRSGCVVLFKISGYLILILFDFLTKRSVETIENPVLFISRFYLHRHRLLLSGQLIDHGLTGIHEFKFFLWWKKSITSAYESNLINQQ